MTRIFDVDSPEVLTAAGPFDDHFLTTANRHHGTAISALFSQAPARPIGGAPAVIYRFGPFELDGRARELRKDGVRVDAEPKALELLLYLAARPDEAVSKDELQNELWPRAIVTETALTRSVMKARRAVDDDSSRQEVIRTVHGHGYRFVAELDADAPGLSETPAAEPAAAEARAGRPLWHYAVAAMAILVVVIGFALNFDGLTSTRLEGRIALAVLPVSDETADESLGWVRVGLMSLLGRMLEDNGVAIVADREVLAAVGESRIPRPLDDAFLSRIREITDARQVLDVTLSFQNGLYRMSAVLATGEGDRLRRVIVGDSPAAVAADMARVVGGMIVDDDGLPDRRLRRVSSDPFINEAYARGLAMELTGDLEEARTLFAVAAKQEPELFWLRYEIALCTRDLREYDEAESQFDALLAEARAASDVEAELATLNSLGVMYLTRDRYDEARTVLEQAMRIDGPGIDGEDRGIVHINLALVANNQGRRPDARQHYEAALAAFDDAEMSPNPSFFNNYAGFLMNEGRLAEAQEWSERAVDGFQVRGHRRYEASALNRLARILRQRGDPDAALERHEQALAIQQELGNEFGEIVVLMAMTNAYRDKGELTRARLNAIDVRDRSLALDHNALIADAHMYLAQTEEDLGDHESARTEYVAARNRFVVMGTPPGLRAADEGIARTTLRLGDTTQAMALAEELRASADEAGDARAARRASALVAAALRADGRHDEAIDLYLRILTDAREAEDELQTSSVSVELADEYLDLGRLADASALLEELGDGTEPDQVRAAARLAALQGDTARAAEMMTALRSRVAEAWRDEDERRLAGWMADAGN